MQIMLDTNTDTPRDLLALAKFLTETYSEPTADSIPAKTVEKADAAPSIAIEIPPAPTTAPVEATDADDDSEPEVTHVNAAPPAPTVLEFDSAGLPYDSRIHNDKKTKKINGEWKNRKNLDAAILASVTAELEPLRITTDNAPVTAPPAPAVPAGTTTLPVAPPPPAAAPIAPPPPATVTVPSAVSTDAPGEPATLLSGANAQPLTFRTLMQRVTADLNAGKLSKAQVDAGLTLIGLDSIGALITAPQLVPAMAEYLDSVQA